MHEYYSYLAERLNYDSETGNLIWNDKAFWKVRGKIAGTVGDRGYLKISVHPKGLKLKNIRVHRFIWWLHNGDIPEGMEIDHIDRDKLNNRIENLRLATRNQNQSNTITRSTTSGYKSITLNKRGFYVVKLKCDNKYYYYGEHSDLERAKTIAAKVRFEHFGEFA